MAAAPTTSLPETIGGVRNWDYRYVWIRDSALTAQALISLGHNAEAIDLLNWIENISAFQHEHKHHFQIRDVARNNAPKIAPDFGSYSRRIEGCILIVCAPQCNAEYGPKDKQDGGIISCYVPYTRSNFQKSSNSLKSYQNPTYQKIIP